MFTPSIGWQTPSLWLSRRRGKGVEDAEDATQGFFSSLLARNLFADAERELGRLRTFLLTAFQRYLSGEWDRERAQKRGGGCEPEFLLRQIADTLRDPNAAQIEDGLASLRAALRH